MATSLADLKAKYGALTGSAEEYELLDPTSASAKRRTTVAGQEVYLPDYYRESGRLGTFTNITNPFARAQAQAELKLAGSTAAQNVAFSPTGKNLEGDLAALSQQYNVGQNVIVEARRAAATTPVVSETGAGTDKEIQSIQERQALPATGTASIADKYWDASRGVQVYAKPGEHFELYAGGGVRIKQGPMPAGATGAPASSLFTQPTAGGKPVEGFKEEQLGITPAEGKEIKRTGRTGFNPKTGADVPVGPDEIFIEYTDGTFEVRKVSSINEPGEPKSIEEAGKTIDELRADQGLPPLKGETDNSNLEYIGREYTAANGKKRVADEGKAFYQDPSTRTILERPDTGAENALPSTSPSVLAARNDISSMFTAVYGREPNEQELAYWKGRTNKKGAALIGAMQFAKNQGKAIGAQPKEGDIGDPISAINTALNESQGVNLSKISNITPSTDLTSKSAQMIERLVAGITQLEEPTSLQAEYKKQLETTGYSEDLAELAEAERALKQLEADFITTLQEEEGRKVSMTQVRRRQSAEQLAYDRVRRDLQVERDYIANKVANKQAIINTMVSLMGQDISNAQAWHQNQFQNAISLTNLMRQVEQDQISQVQREKDENRANLQIMTNLLSSGNISYNQLEASTKAQIKQMEAIAGMPAGFTQFVGQVTKDPVVNFGSSITRPDGTVVQPVFTIDPATGEFKTTYIAHGKERIPASGSAGGGSPTESQLLVAAKQITNAELNAESGGDGKVSPETWNRVRRDWVSTSPYTAQDFDDAYRGYINTNDPGWKKNYQTTFDESFQKNDSGYVEVP